MKDFPRIFLSSSSEFAAFKEKRFCLLLSELFTLPLPKQEKGGGVEGKGCGVFCLGRFFVVVDSLNIGQLVLGACVSVYQENMADAICSRKQYGRVHL